MTSKHSTWRESWTDDDKRRAARLYDPLQAYFRPRRMRWFMETLRPEAGMKILDVGGTAFNWSLIDCAARVTLLNLEVDQEEALGPGLDCVEGDATALPFDAGSFDIVFSNSMIEHLYSYAKQEAFAREASRVGKALWIQTPAKYFPIDPHLITPGFHFLPKPARRRLVRNFTLKGWITRPTQEQVDGMLDEVRLLSLGEMKALFPDARILRERALGLTKSYIALRRF